MNFIEQYSVNNITSYITGGDPLQGAVQGLVVYFANHLAHVGEGGEDNTKQENEIINDPPNTFEKIEDALAGLGISNDAKLAIMSLAKGDMKALQGYLKMCNGLGRVIGALGTGIAFTQYIDNPTTANLLNLTVSVSAVFATPAAGVVLGVADVTGLSSKVYNFIGKTIDSQVGYSVGKAVFDNTKSFFNQFQLTKP